MKAKIKILGLLVPIVLLLDQMTKHLILQYVPLGTSIPVIPGIFDIVHTRNRGAAFGFLSDLPDSLRFPFFFTVSSVALILITVYFFSLKDDRRGIFVGLALILGGAFGNIWDRIRLGEVVDFLSFHWYDTFVNWHLGRFWLSFKLEWPAFNVADSAISVGAVWLMILMTRRRS